MTQHGQVGAPRGAVRAVVPSARDTPLNAAGPGRSHPTEGDEVVDCPLYTARRFHGPPGRGAGRRRSQHADGQSAAGGRAAPQLLD